MRPFVHKTCLMPKHEAHRCTYLKADLLKVGDKFVRMRNGGFKIGRQIWYRNIYF